MSTNGNGAIRNRVKELRMVAASDLLAHPANWRLHPDSQRRAMKATLQELGYADALIARETPEGLQLIDGHLRKETTPDALVPVLVVDLDEHEAAKLLATLDPIAAMAEADRGALREVMGKIQTQNEEFAKLIEEIAERERVLDLGKDLDDPGPGEPPAEAVTRTGDLWVLGEHRLWPT